MQLDVVPQVDFHLLGVGAQLPTGSEHWLRLRTRVQLDQPVEEQPHDVALRLSEDLAVHIGRFCANADAERAASFRTKRAGGRGRGGRRRRWRGCRGHGGHARRRRWLGWRRRRRW